MSLRQLVRRRAGAPVMSAGRARSSSWQPWESCSSSPSPGCTSGRPRQRLTEPVRPQTSRRSPEPRHFRKVSAPHAAGPAMWRGVIRRESSNALWERGSRCSSGSRQQCRPAGRASQRRPSPLLAPARLKQHLSDASNGRGGTHPQQQLGGVDQPRGSLPARARASASAISARRRASSVERCCS